MNIVVGVGDRAGGEGFDPPQRLPVDHVEPLPLFGELPAALIELATQECDFLPQLGHQLVGAIRRLVGCWDTVRSAFGACWDAGR